MPISVWTLRAEWTLFFDISRILGYL
uniref:Uncharacterized protein n=1 Tax=Ditylenchus dipsaci TaxID=166011 RepID=A0A915CV32_9BILA